MKIRDKLTITADTIYRLLELPSGDLAYVLRSAMLEVIHGEDNETCDEKLNVVYRSIMADTTAGSQMRRVA